MKQLCCLLVLSIFFPAKIVFSQKSDKKIDDLTFLYVDEKYDKAIAKGEALMQSDSYRKHPLVYIYTSMSYYEMAKRPGEFDVGEKDSKFPKPLKMAQKHLYKFVKTDKKAPKYYDNSWYDDFKEYYEQIADTSNDLAQYLFLNEKYRKAASVYKYAYKAVPADPVLRLWQGISEVKARNTSEGNKNIIGALEVIDKDFTPSKATSDVLARGMLIIEEYLRGISDYSNADKAKELVEVFKKYDPDELDKKKMEERKKKAQSKDHIMRKFYSDEDDEDNKMIKGKVNIQNGYGSNGEEVKSAEDELDRLEKEASGGK